MTWWSRSGVPAWTGPRRRASSRAFTARGGAPPHSGRYAAYCWNTWPGRKDLDYRYVRAFARASAALGSAPWRRQKSTSNVVAGQSLMAVRSFTELWIDANFKETQLAELRIGQRVRCEVDMYGEPA